MTKEKIITTIEKLQNQYAELQAELSDLETAHAEALANETDTKKITDRIIEIEHTLKSLPRAIENLEQKHQDIEDAEYNKQLADFKGKASKELNALQKLGGDVLDKIGEVMNMIGDYSNRSSSLVDEALDLGVSRAEALRVPALSSAAISLLQKGMNQNFGKTAGEAVGEFEDEFQPVFKNLPNFIESSMR